jgi:molybdenum cofactor synthesis domain-containing protein
MLALDIAVYRDKHDITLEHAHELIVANVPVVGCQSIPLWSALGNVLRQDISSDVDHPTADISTRDGYCLDASQTRGASPESPVTLTIRGAITAGTLPDVNLAAGECASVATGAVLPAGANAVVMTEEANPDDDVVRISRRVAPGECVRGRGEVVSKGERVMQAGRLLVPSALGLLAAFGVEAVLVSKEVQVGILATGNELVPHKDFPDRGKVRDSNAKMLTALADEMWLAVFDAQIASDTLADLDLHIRNCSGCEIVVITGGTGVGEHDLALRCLQNMGASIIVSGLNMRPGKRVIFAKRSEQAVFCLPGNPVGCFVLFHMLVKPALLAMMGSIQPLPVPIKGRWIPSTRDLPPVRTLMPSRLLPDLGVEPLGPGELGNVLRLVEANSIVSLPDDMGRVRHDQVVDVFPVGSIPWTGA